MKTIAPYKVNTKYNFQGSSFHNKRGGGLKAILSLRVKLTHIKSFSNVKIRINK